jgi:hypothetical protein
MASRATATPGNSLPKTMPVKMHKITQTVRYFSKKLRLPPAEGGDAVAWG